MANQFWRKVKAIDRFKVTPFLMLHRRDQTTDKKINYYEMGTKCGGISTILIYLGLLSYFASALAQMYTAR